MLFLMMIDTAEDKRKFEILYEKYRSLMMKVAVDVLHDNYLAEDAVHNAFLKIAQNMSKIKELESLETKRYLVIIVKNASIDIYRKRSKQMKQEIFLDELGDNILPVTDMGTEEDNKVLDVLIGLPVKYRDVFLLKYSSCLDNREISELLGIKEGAIRQRIARGKEMIEKALKRLEEVENESITGN